MTMPASILTLTRIFRSSGQDLPDPNPELSPEEVLRHYARSYPRLLGAKIIDPIIEGDRHVYEFRQASFGAKG